MSENFFHDNSDLEFRLAQIDLREALELKEKGYSQTAEYPGSPRNYADAKDNYSIILGVMGEICGERVAPRAAEADEEGAISRTARSRTPPPRSTPSRRSRKPGYLGRCCPASSAA